MSYFLSPFSMTLNNKKQEHNHASCHQFKHVSKGFNPKNPNVYEYIIDSRFLELFRAVYDIKDFMIKHILDFNTEHVFSLNWRISVNILNALHE